jgi:hypothetical protein
MLQYKNYLTTIITVAFVSGILYGKVIKNKTDALNKLVDMCTILKGYS